MNISCCMSIIVFAIAAMLNAIVTSHLSAALRHLRLGVVEQGGRKVVERQVVAAREGLLVAWRCAGHVGGWPEEGTTNRRYIGA